MPVSDAFDLARLPIADWQPAGLPSADMGLLQSTDGLRIGPDKTSSRTKCSGIEWRVGPPRHVGAMSPQLLYRSTKSALCNSFLTVLPADTAPVLRDTDVVARIFTPDGRNGQLLHVYQGWVVARLRGVDQLDGYMAAIYRERRDHTDVGSIWRVTGGLRTDEVAAAYLGNKVDWTKPWHCRLNLKGYVLKAKWWSYDVIEPESWDLAGADDAHAHAGLMGFAATVHGGIASNIWGLDWYAWSADPDVPAPLYPDD